jgi:hypothetical protein
MTPLLEYPADWAVGAAVEPVLQAMFRDYTKIVLQKEFTEGQSGTQVFLALPYRTNMDRELPVVVKIGATELIEQEWLAASRYATRRLPGFLAIVGEPTYVDVAGEGAYGGLQYELAGNGLFRIESLRTYSRQSKAVDLWMVVEKHLFPQLAKTWSATPQRHTRYLQASYDRVLPVNLLIDALPESDSAVVAGAGLLLAGEVRDNLMAFQSIPSGTLVRLEAFQVTEIVRYPRAITLNLPQQGEIRQTSFRLRVQGIADLAAYRVGAIAPTIVGRVRASRQELLTDALQGVLGEQVSLQMPTLSLPGAPAVAVPNPLHYWPALLHQALPMKIGTVHGDLNMGNVLVDPQAHTTQIIDCAHARREHVLYDLVRLETETLLHTLAAGLLRTEQPPTLIYELYGWLDQVSRTEAHDHGQFALPQPLPTTLPALTPTFILLSMIRNAVRDYLATPNDWREYYSGLALSLLGALKFASLQRAPVGQQPKVIAFWGAATLMHLLSNQVAPQTGQWTLVDLTKPLVESAASAQPTPSPPLVRSDQRSSGIYFEGNQSVNIGGNVISGGTVNQTIFQGAVTGPVHTGSGDLHIYQGNLTGSRGDVNVGKGDFVGRDKSVHDEVHGDKISNVINAHIVNIHHATEASGRTFQFQALIDEATKDFVGREYIYRAIDAFVTSQPQGYVIVEGDPGMGKTALLANFVQQQHCIAYFNERLAGRNRSAQFLESICRQLIERYQLPYPSLPRNATEDGSFLAQLLNEISLRLSPGERLLIAVDALDEVDLTTHIPGANLLYLPERLPPAIYFVLTRRRMADAHLRIRMPQLLVNLVDYHTDSQRDIHTYIRRAAEDETRRQLRAWLQRQALSTDQFVQVLAEKSEDNFMYLYHMVSALDQGTLYLDRGLTSLPVGLQGYYQDHWRYMRGQAGDEIWFHYKLPVIMALTAVREPVSIELIRHFSKVEEYTRIRAVLQEWVQFLREVKITEGGGPQKRYRLYHTSFHDFIVGLEEVADERVDLKVTHSQIANTLWEDLFGHA